MSEEKWSPPFCANEIEDVACPKCGAEAVRVREKETYSDGDCVEAYCGECRTMLEIYATVSIEFSDPEVIE